MCRFTSREEAQAFVKKHHIQLVIYHNTRILPQRKSWEIGLDHLESCVPFLNTKAVHIADDKFETKRILRARNLPVLPDAPITNRTELWQSMEENALYVGKFHNSESGRGVKLLKRTATDFFEYLDGSWRKIQVRDTEKGLSISGSLGLYASIVIGLCIFSLIPLIFNLYPLIALFVIALLIIIMGIMHIPYKLDQNFTYSPLMLEPFFGDDTREFYCLRCTVIGDKVVESAKKTNKKNVTPNISHGGKATHITLSPEQIDMAIAATQAVGATYAGIDLLCSRGKTVICEVNVGPIGVYCEQTKVPVGELLGEYAMHYCDTLALSGSK